MKLIDSGVTTFTVDSELLRELGERLVGKPHIALAELVKNSYDADALHVDILYEETTEEPSNHQSDEDDVEASANKEKPSRKLSSIQVVDNGHGMDPSEFNRFWMRVGSPHKRALKTSEKFARPLTGSKGVGRLAVQFLARKIEIITAREGAAAELRATIDWDQAVAAGELTKAEAVWKSYSPVTTRFARGKTHGTSIRLTRLNQSQWSEDDFEGLAQEIWWLQAPFVDPTRDNSESFSIEFTTPDPKILQRFERQMLAFMDLWYAKIEGKLFKKKMSDDQGEEFEESWTKVALQFDDGERHVNEWRVAGCLIDSLRFEVRTYYLSGRQKYGIKVGEARKYFEEHGGVYVYDAGFRLPYYGGKEHDWLRLEFDHAHRLSHSRLLPEELNIEQGLNYLPTNSRILGFVYIDTSHERTAHEDTAHERTAHQGSEPGDLLQIQITRDRLADNRAYRQLSSIVRRSIDFYAVMEARRAHQRKEKEQPIEIASKKWESVGEVLAQYRNQIPSEIFSRLDSGIRKAVEASEVEAESIAGRMALIGPLAAAGMAALAHEHEVGKQLLVLEDLRSDLERLATSSENLRTAEFSSVSDRLGDWIHRARQTRRLFTHLLDADNREMTVRLRARDLLREISDQSRILLRGTSVDTQEIDESLKLPLGTFAEWTALFQNIIINASNAMLDSEERSVRIFSRSRGRRREILVEDSGVGIDLKDAQSHFEPFSRAMEISPARRELGLGGTGLGLTIVKMIAENRGCSVDFVEPSPGFSTAFRLQWKEI